MIVEYDPKKNEINVQKHGLSLGFASQLDWGNALIWIDKREDYGEARMICLAPASGILYYVAFVDRRAARRVISLRRANTREVKYYAKSG